MNVLRKVQAAGARFCGKRTWQPEIRILALAELEGTAGLSLTKLLTLYGAAVAAHQAFLLEGRTEFRIQFAEGASDTELNSFSLTLRATTLNINSDIERLALTFQGLQRKLNLILQVHEREI